MVTAVVETAKLGVVVAGAVSEETVHTGRVT
jgi:hypothetical protein